MRHEVIDLPPGWAGTDLTVGYINKLILDGLKDPNIVLFAQGLVRWLPERDKGAEIRAVSDFVRKNIRYTNEGIETLKTPGVLLAEYKRYGKATGDCDDHVILWMTLHRALGNPTRVQVVSQRKNGIASHVYAEVLNKQTGKWVTDDTIVKSKPLGWKAPSNGLTKKKTYDGLGGLSAMKLTDTVRDEFNLGDHVGGARQCRGGYVPGMEHYAVRQDTVPSALRIRGRRGMAITVDDGTNEGLGFSLMLPTAPAPTEGGTTGTSKSFDWGSLITTGISTAGAIYAQRQAAKAEKKRQRMLLRLTPADRQPVAAPPPTYPDAPPRPVAPRRPAAKPSEGMSTTTMVLIGLGVLGAGWFIMRRRKR